MISRGRVLLINKDSTAHVLAMLSIIINAGSNDLSSEIHIFDLVGSIGSYNLSIFFFKMDIFTSVKIIDHLNK